MPAGNEALVLHQEVVPEIRLAQLQRGSQLPIKVDPRDPRNFAIAWR